MGDKGRKDRDKSKKQRSRIHAREMKRKQDKQQKPPAV